jgi:hypothetical protein
VPLYKSKLAGWQFDNKYETIADTFMCMASINNNTVFKILFLDYFPKMERGL